MSNKYPALSTIATIFKALGWVTIFWTAALVIVGVVVVFANGQYLGGGFFGFLGQILGAIWGSLMLLVLYGVLGGTVAVLYFASAEGLQVLMDIEENTRSK